MSDFAVWRVAVSQSGEDPPEPQSPPSSVERSHDWLECHLEGWIEADATLIGGGLTIVGRQITMDDGRLDLLAIDSQDRWVVIEIKAGLLDSGALTQALYYASSLARLTAEDLHKKLERSPNRPDAAEQQARVRQILDNEDEEREIAVLLVGIGISPGLERMKEFLGRFGVPISAVSFEVFAHDAGSKLLIRKTIEEPASSPRGPRPPGSVKDIRERAVKAGVAAQFDRFVKMSEDAGLVVRAFKLSVMIAPRANRGRYLMYANPRKGGIGIAAGPEPFAEFFNVTEAEAREALGPSSGIEFLTGAELDERLDQIEKFLAEKLQQPPTDSEGTQDDDDAR